MKTRFWMTLVLSLLLAVSWAGAEEIAGLPLHIEKLNDGVIRLWLGDHISSTTTFAFATEKGIVVVDTFGIPEVDAQLREAIARELGRSDFTYLINTHEHGDHTGGNAVYSDCTIVGHELIAAGMAEAAGQRDRMLAWYPGRIADIEAELQSLAADAPEAVALEEDLNLNRLNFHAVEAAAEQAPPTLTFSDRMTLDLGDTTFELSYIGGMHTASDTAILVPEHGLLLTGDTMADVWLTDTPGCLASFSVRSGVQHDFPRMLANWDRLLADRERFTTLMPAHWNGELSIEGAEARVEYVRALWNAVNQAAEADQGIEAVLTENQLAARFPSLAESPGFSAQGNHASITELWREVTNQASAARTVFELLGEGADEEAILLVVGDRDSEAPGYFYFEAEFNAYGYAFIQQDRIDEAVRMFEINVELFPESWNTYDSLGEALLRKGETDAAVAMYEKSLVLNPESPSGKEALATIKSGTST
jgi:glyoxylase-like metal-dependent hydrolase (beta-lactamase superfamily II)